MNIYKSNLWISDIDRVLSVLPELSKLEGKSVLITGASGLICSAIIDVIIRYNETQEGKIRIFAAGRNTGKIKKRFSDFAARDYFTLVEYDAEKPGLAITSYADYIIHGASNAYPDKIVMEPVETMVSNFVGALNLLNYAREHGSQRLLYISSSEVYGKKVGNQPYQEGEYGYIDLLNSRNSYSIAKCAAETLCASYTKEYGIETVIVRPGHIYGPTASQTDNRVSSQWPYKVVRREDIVMKTDGSQIRSYCYCLDCASAILLVLLNGETGCAYNISNPDSVIDIRQMAELLVKSADVKLRMECPTEEERKGFNPMSNSSLEATSLINLGWKACFDAETGLAHTVQIIKETL